MSCERQMLVEEIIEELERFWNQEQTRDEDAEEWLAAIKECSYRIERKFWGNKRPLS